MKRITNAIIVKSWKPHYIFGGLLILTATWLGYFIGYSHTPYDVKSGLLVINGEMFRGQLPKVDHSEDVQEFVKSNGRIQVRYRKKTVEEESIQYIPINRDHLDQVVEVPEPRADTVWEKFAKLPSVDNAAGSKSKEPSNAKEDEEIELQLAKSDQKDLLPPSAGQAGQQGFFAQLLTTVANKDLVTHRAKLSDSMASQVTLGPTRISKTCSAKHGRRSSAIPCIRKRTFLAMPPTVQEEAYIFTSKKLPGYPKYRPSLANGHIGTAVHNTIMCMNGLYSGYLTASHRAAIPSMVNWNVTGTEPPTQFTRSYELNVGIGVFSEISLNEKYTLTQRFYAHRVIKELFVVEVEVEYPAANIAPITFTIEQPQWTASYDLTFHEPESDIKDVTYKVGVINAPETLNSPREEVHILYDHVPETLTASEKRTKWTFLVSVGHTKNDTYAAYARGSELIHKTNSLYTSHCQAWADVWQKGRIDVAGNVRVARAVYSSFFYIISSLALQHHPEFPFYGLSPSGLAFGYDSDYWGHVFWDQDMWMYPGILMFHPDLARIILLSRERTYDMAKDNAKRSGDRGIRFPWESAATGIETSPSDICSKYEIHVTGDIGLSILNYLYMTNDTQGLANDRLVQMSKDIADFFMGRLVYNQAQDRYEIHDVQGPDEDHAPVNNSAMTNALAKACMTAPYELNARMGTQTKPLTKLKDVADKIYIPFDPELRYHPEFDGYKKGVLVKQADVVLMGYPVGYEMPLDVRKNDMLFYEGATQPGGPAMTSSLYSIGWLEIGEMAKANASFQHNFYYIRNEFQVWSETILGGAANFITGMGGFLQNMVFGYGGFRIHRDRLDFNPLVVPGSSAVSFVGLNYLGSTFDVLVNDKRVSTVNITSQLPSSVSLKLKLMTEQKVVQLVVGKVVQFQAQPCSMGPFL